MWVMSSHSSVTHVNNSSEYFDDRELIAFLGSLLSENRLWSSDRRYGDVPGFRLHWTDRTVMGLGLLGGQAARTG